MNIMLNLNFSNTARPTAIELRQRPCMDIFEESVETQLQAIVAEKKGDGFKVKKTRYREEGGRRVKKDIEVRVRPWWWTEDTGKGVIYNLTMKYGSQTVAVKDKPTIVAGKDLNAVEKVLKAILEATKSRDA
ncbi:hypothetical protein, partial [Magnetovibrio blakemorei]